jgi:hypothetical protein
MVVSPKVDLPHCAGKSLSDCQPTLFADQAEVGLRLLELLKID